VAAGRLDGFFEKGLKPWDIAAGSLLITEAGGIVGTSAASPIICTKAMCWPAIRNLLATGQSVV